MIVICDFQFIRTTNLLCLQAPRVPRSYLNVPHVPITQLNSHVHE